MVHRPTASYARHQPVWHGQRSFDFYQSPTHSPRHLLIPRSSGVSMYGLYFSNSLIGTPNHNLLSVRLATNQITQPTRSKLRGPEALLIHLICMLPIKVL